MTMIMTTTMMIMLIIIIKYFAPFEFLSLASVLVLAVRQMHMLLDAF